MDDQDTQFDLSNWSLEERKKLLIAISQMADGNKKSYKTFETSIKWDSISLDGRSDKECKAMYLRLVHKIRKTRTMKEVAMDALSMMTDDGRTPVNEHMDAPKKPLTAFSLFIKKRSKKFPDIKGTNRMKVFANDWNELSEEKKEFYKRKYQKLKQKYETKLDTFRHNHPDVPIPGSGAPQPPLPACKLFVESRLEKLKIKEPELTQTEAVKKLTIKYKKLSDKKKLKWINRAKDGYQAYLEQYETYLSNNPKSTLKQTAFHLSKDEQRIWDSSKGKPLTMPSKNIFKHFCTTQRDNFQHLSFSEQSRMMSGLYHQLSEDELKELTDKFLQEVRDYVQSYTEYYQSLSEEERNEEKSPDEALAQYNKILENDKKNQIKKLKKQSKDMPTKSKKSRLSDVFPLPQDENEDDDSNTSTSLFDVAPPKRKIEVEPSTPHKKRKKEHRDGTPPVNMATDADDLLSMWSPLRNPEHSSENKVTTPQSTTKSKASKRAEK